jgi:hypothetical protein
MCCGSQSLLVYMGLAQYDLEQGISLSLSLTIAILLGNADFRALLLSFIAATCRFASLIEPARDKQKDEGRKGKEEQFGA